MDNFGCIYDGAAELVGSDVNTAKKMLNELWDRLGMWFIVLSHKSMHSFEIERDRPMQLLNFSWNFSY